MEIYRVTFAGHREIDNFYLVVNKLDKIIFDLLQSKDYVEFYVGNDGEFDLMATASIRRMRKKYGNDNSELNLVLPYKKANIDLLETQFDTVIIPAVLYGVHPKRAIIQRNRWMVDHSHLLICYVEKIKWRVGYDDEICHKFQTNRGKEFV